MMTAKHVCIRGLGVALHKADARKPARKVTHIFGTELVVNFSGNIFYRII